VNILDAIEDENLFRPFLGDDLITWSRWAVALRALYGLPIASTNGHALVEDCTGRRVAELPWEGFKTALFLVGRRSGKSRISALIGAFEALFGGHETDLAKGEVGILPIISPSRHQSMIVWRYLQSIFETPLLQQEVAEVKESDHRLKLRNGIEIRILTGDFRTVRGPTVICAIIDEICFFGVADDSFVRSDTELVRAIRPALVTTKGKLIGISSPYQMKGWAYQQFRKQHGKNRGHPEFQEKWRGLVWNAASRVMNPTLSQAEIDAAFAEDPMSARSEFLGEWREDIEEFVPRALIERRVIPGRKELMPRTSLAQEYRAGVDLSGGRRDSAALVIIHRERGRIVQDLAKEWRAPLNPFEVVGEIARELKRFGLSSVQGDNYAGEWGVEAFRQYGIHYGLADKPKPELYRELLPILCGASIELLDHPTQTNQLASLERRPRSGGKDVIDHPRGAHDDVANALAVAVDFGTGQTLIAGGIRTMVHVGAERVLVYE
jgi:hypothetical protein